MSNEETPPPSLFKHEKTETGGHSWQFKIPLPIGRTFTFSIEKNQVVANGSNLREMVSKSWKAITAPIADSSESATDNKGSGVGAFGLNPNVVFLICIIIYIVIRLIGLTDYPVYFNFDEANKPVLAADFLRDGFRNYSGELWPAFFPNPGNNYNVGSTAVYVQILPMLLFGRSDFVIRFTVVLLGLIGAICISLALRDIFKVRYWWVGILVLSVIPTWFHHSRTGYEMPIFASFYGTMLYCYWLYRSGKKGFIYPAVLFAGMAFYSYAPAQAIIPLTVVAIFLLDIKYHFRAGKAAIGGAVLGVICVLPYIRFQIDHDGSSAQVLSRVTSYLVQDIPLIDKIGAFIRLYLFHLSPSYWFTPADGVTQYDGLLHIMKGYGHLGLGLIPFLFWGLWLLLRHLRQMEYRTLLAAFLISPVSASLVTSPSSITRALVMVIPVSIIACIGLDDLLKRAAGRFHFNKYASSILFTVLLLINSYMLWDVLTNGISWFDNNQASGVQFGASKLFPAVKAELDADPTLQAIISPQWAMVEDMVSRIYLGDNANVIFSSMYDYDRNITPIQENSIFAITPEEYDFIKENPKFSIIKILKVIPYSPQKAGFYLLRLKYSPKAQAIFDAEWAEKLKPLQGEFFLNGEKVLVDYTKNDGTEISAVFDGNPNTLYKTAEINPAIFTLTFAQPKEFRSVYIVHGAANIEFQVTFLSASGETVKTSKVEFRGRTTGGNTIQFEPIKATRVNISVHVVDANESGIVHIWDIEFNK